jgi:ribonuclease HII
MPSRPSLDREKLAWKGGGLFVGVDEAGRGPLAGPVVAAAVVFPANIRRTKAIRDSKTLSELQRNDAALRIRKTAFAIGVGAASCREIDRINIRRATALAMRRAIARVMPHCPALGIAVCIDGLAMPEIGFDHEALVDGDALCLSISAASIIAKTVRDRLMRSLGRRYPVYDWEHNKGYGTDGHRSAIDEHGPTPHHRRTFMPIAQLGLWGLGTGNWELGTGGQE